MPDHAYFSTLIWQIADLLRGPYRPPQYERVMLPMTVLRRFDCVLAERKPRVLAEYARLSARGIEGPALDARLNKIAGQRFHNHSHLDFKKLRSDPDNVHSHLASYIRSFSGNVREIFDFFEFENEIERMEEANILYLVVSKFGGVGPPSRARWATSRWGSSSRISSAASMSWPTRPPATTSPRARSSGSW